MFSSKKPYSSVTVYIERLTGEAYEEDDLSGIPDLVEAIKLQSTGTAEAARAIRKKLKYGSLHRQLRALTILDGLIQNAGARFQRTFADEPLLDRLRFCATSDLTDRDVRKKCRVLFAQWAAAYRKTPGLERIVALHTQQPRRKEPVTQAQSRVLRETERDPFEDGEDSQEAEPASPVMPRRPSAPTSPTASASASLPPILQSKPKKEKEKDKKRKSKGRSKPFNLEAEKEKMKVAIAESSIKSTNLLNAMQSINREQEQVSNNPVCVKLFESCKLLRRMILRYIQHVEAEEWLGALIQANDNLVQALMTFEQLDRSIDADSDSEDEAAEQAHLYKMATLKGKERSTSDTTEALAGLHITTSAHTKVKPPVPARPSAPPVVEDDDTEEEEDENDPFADRNAVVI